jgi:NosR/NirI family nitrous oxide reductase transcriptional regulator
VTIDVHQHREVGISPARSACAGLLLCCLLMLLHAFGGVAAAREPGSDRLVKYLEKLTPADLVEGADAFGAYRAQPPSVPVMKGGETLGYALLTTDYTRSIGYSGKPLHIVFGLDMHGAVTAVKLMEHSEPIVLAGIPEASVVKAMNSLVGKDYMAVAAGGERPPDIDIVSGATVTMLVIGDSIARAATVFMRNGGIGGQALRSAAATTKYTLNTDVSALEDWKTLVGDGSVRNLRLSVGEVNDAFRAAGETAAAERPEKKDPAENFIDLYVTLATVPAIGRSVLGEAAYNQLLAKLKPGQQAILVAGKGAYSFKGSGYVRGGIFDRVELLQDGETIRFHDYHHTRVVSLAAKGAPRFPEIALFVIPEQTDFDPTKPFELRLLVQRLVSARQKAFQSFGLDFTLPPKYLKAEAVPAAAAPSPEAGQGQGANAAATPPAGDFMEEQPFVRVWRANTVNAGITVAALGFLTILFFFQKQFVSRPNLFRWIRRGFLLFTIVWLGWILRAQLSVVNVLAWFNALQHEFSWGYFLMEPQIFLLWLGVAAALLFWGRGPFCGWLCPVGAVQEFCSIFAKALKIPQIRVPWGLHERLWPFKYIIFMALFGLSMYSLALAEIYAEVEPFRTFFLLRFAREWPYVVYALTLLAAGLFIERFFCRYLCPLGAALAIPGRLRMFDWLKRYRECGNPCALCANECPVQAIHPDGAINVNECIYCMNCQMLYEDDRRCPFRIRQKARREKLKDLSPVTPDIAREGA